jgi:hypothetical protein
MTQLSVVVGAAAIAVVACGPRDPAPGPAGGGTAGGGRVVADRDPVDDQPATADDDRDAPEIEPPAPSRGGDAAVLLDEHNRYRAQHCTPPLTWSDDLAKVAQRWADTLRDSGCAFEHSQTPYGENLAAGTTGALPPDRAVAMWYREVDDYDFKKGGFSMKTGHFTQLVWKGTQRLGCGKATCRGLDLWVCNYDPPGNVDKGYKANVLAARSKC